MSDPFDDRLRARLDRLSEAIPVHDPGTRTTRGRGARSRQITLRGVVLAGALFLLVSLGATAAFLRLDRPHAHDSAFAPGGPLHCTRVDQLSPPDAERWLHEHGFDVAWQVVDRERGTDVHQDAAPDRGSIITVLVTGDGRLLVLVDLSNPTPIAPRPCP